MIMIDISTFDIGRYIMASMSGLVLIIGLFVIGIGVNIKKDEEFVCLGYSIMFIAMGIFIATGVPLDVLLMGMDDIEEKYKNISFFEKYKLFIIFGICVFAFGMYNFFRYFNLESENNKKMLSQQAEK